MKTKTYSEKLKDPRWQKKRLKILERDNWICKKCGDDKTTFNIHHIEYYNGNPWDTPDLKLVTLCEDCHRTIEKLKKDKKIELPDFKNILIYKIKWDDNTKIIFMSTSNYTIIDILDNYNNYIVQYGIGPNHTKDIITVLRKVVKLNNG